MTYWESPYPLTREHADEIRRALRGEKRSPVTAEALSEAIEKNAAKYMPPPGMDPIDWRAAFDESYAAWLKARRS